MSKRKMLRPSMFSERTLLSRTFQRKLLQNKRLLRRVLLAGKMIHQKEPQG